MSGASSLFVLSLPTSSVICCRVHEGCYTLDTVDRHLSDAHKLRRQERVLLLQEWRDAGVASQRRDVNSPPDGSLSLPGLPLRRGFRCCSSECRVRSTNEDTMKIHCRKIHSWSSYTPVDVSIGLSSPPQTRTENTPSDGYAPTLLQTLWTHKSHIDYFIVSSSSPADVGPVIAPPPTIWEGVKARFELAQSQTLGRSATVAPLDHISELTPWLRDTQFHNHIVGLPVAALPTSYRLPKDIDEPVLALICRSVAHVLRRGMALLDHELNRDVPQLSRLNAKLLNTFRRAEMSADPIKRLQNDSTCKNYIAGWQKLVCYFHRVANEAHFPSVEPALFKVTPEEKAAFDCLWEAATRDVVSAPSSPNPTRTSDDEQLEQLALRFSTTLIKHRLEGRAFDSAMVSFAAVAAWDATRQTWLAVNNYTSLLSQLIYDAQLIVLLDSCELVASSAAPDLQTCLVAYRDQWLLNDTNGPIAELSSIRLLGFKIGRSTVNTAQVRWHEDEETIVYKDVTLHLDQLRQLVSSTLSSAQSLLEGELCLKFGPLPKLDLRDLVDNWDASQPGQSFLTDARNSQTLEGHGDWLINELQRHPKALRLFGTLPSSNSSEPWALNPIAVATYAAARQRFLEQMLVLVHLTSGQPARRPELLGLRWCNRQADKRNVFLHDGYVLFILTYHKSLNLTNGSRFPVRFLLPEVGLLLVRYLALVQPFWTWLTTEVGNPRGVSEYLWHSGTALWSEDKMTDVLIQASSSTIGVRLNTQAWRQIAVGIAIKKFSREGYLLDADRDIASDGHAGPDQEGDGVLLGSLPAAFHWQASHNPRTGNAVYGGTINFGEGLTDAGVQEYLHASRQWHSLCRSPTPTTLKHRRTASLEESTPDPTLLKRLAFRRSEPRGQQSWSMEQALVVLRQMYGPKATYQGKQGAAIAAIIHPHHEIVVVLGTGVGKSLLYQLPSQLPRSQTTILVVPFVALKGDTMQRCEALGIGCRIWAVDAPPDPGCPLVLVSIDQAVQKPFLSYAQQLRSTRALSRIVIDECHLVHSAASYRQRMAQVKHLRALDCQLVCLTATLPPDSVAAFEAALLLTTPVYIRGLTIRTDLQYEVTRVTPVGQQTFEEVVVDLIQQTVATDWFQEAGPLARVLVFVSSRRQADVVASALRCSCYYSDSGPTIEKAAVLSAWRAGPTQILVATSALAGIDYPHVRLVIHLGLPPGGAIDFAQDIGRAGRDGQGGLSVVFLPPTWQPQYATKEGALLPTSITAMERYLDARSCRMAVLSTYLDGSPTSCPDVTTACDRCTAQAARAPPTAVVPRALPSTLRTPDERTTRLSDVTAGAQALRDHTQTVALERDRYARGLDVLRGSCVFCRFLDSTVATDYAHPIHQCPSRYRQKFLTARQAAIAHGLKKRGGWLPRYHACFTCGNLQSFCAQQGRGQCLYRDLLMPLAWAVLHRPDWHAVALPKGAPRQQVVDDESQYMFWLGEASTVFDEQGTNLTSVVNRLLGLILADVPL